MKHDTYSGYADGSGSDRLELPQQTLLTAWDCLVSYQDDLVLIGGLAIRHLTHPPKGGQPGPVTLDVDFGINIAASGGQYASIRDNLSAHGFQWNGKRFKKAVEGMDVHIDLLTEDDRSSWGTVGVDDGLAASLFPGINRALRCYRTLRVEGPNLLGARQTQNIRISEVGPLLVLKLNAFGGPGGRKAPKDAHDILYLALNYLDGTDKALAGFQAEKSAGNPGMVHAMTALRAYFQDANSLGPISCAAFRMDNQHLEPGRREESLRIREQCVTLARELLKE